jgi:hypothetical protein
MNASGILEKIVAHGEGATEFASMITQSRESTNRKGTYQTVSTPDTPRTSVPFGGTVQLFAATWLTIDSPPAASFCLLATAYQAR